MCFLITINSVTWSDTRSRNPKINEGVQGEENPEHPDNKKQLNSVQTSVRHRGNNERRRSGC